MFSIRRTGLCATPYLPYFKKNHFEEKRIKFETRTIIWLLFSVQFLDNWLSILFYLSVAVLSKLKLSEGKLI